MARSSIRCSLAALRQPNYHERFYPSSVHLPLSVPPRTTLSYSFKARGERVNGNDAFINNDDLEDVSHFTAKAAD
ncbi:hypothetical protein PM082_009883 [Marasmius tenuissimus]|nr:hypothetical protein PM082_009883 [Marasmius tenuissimus]